MPRSSSSSRSSGPSRSNNTKSFSRGPATSVPPRQTAPPARQQQQIAQPPAQSRMGGLGSSLMSGFVGGMAFGAGSQLVRGLFGGHGNNSQGDHNNDQGYGNSSPSQSQGSGLLGLLPIAAAGLGGYFFHKMNKGKIASKANKNLFLLKCGGAALGSYLLTGIFCNSISSNRNEVINQGYYNQDMNTYRNANFNQGYTTDYNSNANFGQDRRL